MTMEEVLSGSRWVLLLVSIVFALDTNHHNSARAADRRDSCGIGGFTVVDGNQAELNAACAAVSDIVSYFRAMGFELSPRVTLRFADQSSERTSQHVSDHGYFDPAAGLIVVYRSPQVMPWGLAWTPRLAASFLRHELAHLAIWDIAGRDNIRLRREWHEFIAYAVQIDRLEDDLRDDLLARFAGVQAFSTLMEVHEYAYGMSPEIFAVAAYRTYVAKGAIKFAGQVLRGEIVPPEISHPFPILPSQAQPEK